MNKAYVSDYAANRIKDLLQEQVVIQVELRVWREVENVIHEADSQPADKVLGLTSEELEHVRLSMEDRFDRLSLMRIKEGADVQAGKREVATLYGKLFNRPINSDMQGRT